MKLKTPQPPARSLHGPVFILCLLSFFEAQPTNAVETTPTLYPWTTQAITQHVNKNHYKGNLDQSSLLALIEAGEQLFAAKFNSADGVGRPMSTQAIIPTKRKRPARNQFARTAGLDANACASCHNDPVIGGAGDFSVNVFVSEGFQNTDFDNTDPQFSNERNTNHLFGAGLIELLAREMTADLQGLRSTALRNARNSSQTNTIDLITKGVNFGSLKVSPDGTIDFTGLEGIDQDLVIRPFSQKGVMTSLRQFTVNALNHHHGMQADERYGARWTGQSDFDEDGHHGEISDGDVSALVAWQASRPAPVIAVPDNPLWQQAAIAGKDLFNDIGCAACHIPELPLKSLEFSDPGAYDTAGTRRLGEDNADATYNLELLTWARQLPRNSDGEVLVPLFGDLKRHKIADQEIAHLGNELMAQRFVERDVFITSELWGIASTAPYGHRGDITTLKEIIEVHAGDARVARDKFTELTDEQQQQIIAFLLTLQIPDYLANNDQLSGLYEPQALPVKTQ